MQAPVTDEVTKSMRIRKSINDQVDELVDTRKQHGLTVGPSSMNDAANQALAWYVPRIRKEQRKELKERDKQNVSA